MIRPTTLADLRARGQHLFAAAAVETGAGSLVRWELLEEFDRVGAAVFLAVEDEAALVGYCFAVVSPDLWSPTVALTTWSIYIQPEHRGRSWRHLCHELARQAEQHGATEVRVTAVPGSRLAQLLVREGLTPLAVAYGAPIMHYSAEYGRGRSDHRRTQPGVRRVCGRASEHRPEEGGTQPA